MMPATHARNRHENFRIIHFDRASRIQRVVPANELASLLPPKSLIVVNDAATFPARLKAVREWNDEIVELRFFPFFKSDNVFTAFIFSSFGWTLPTEARLSPGKLRVGEIVRVSDTSLRFEILSVRGRLLTLAINSEATSLMNLLFERGQVVQYSYLQSDLHLYDAQTAYARTPWAAEMPSAGYFLNSEIIADLRSMEIEVVALTHQTGLSSSGDPATDANLPLPESFCIPETTLIEIEKRKSAGNKIIAVGTSVVRALESAPAFPWSGHGPFCQSTSLKISKNHELKVVDGIISGLHSQQETHFELLEAFTSRESLLSLGARAEKENMLSHEFGDLCLIL